MTPDVLPVYEVFAVRYSSMKRTRHDNFMYRDDHDGPMPMDFFVWLLKSGTSAILVDTGFGERSAQERKRAYEGCPIEMLAHLGVSAADIRDVVITHLHYDHAGNLDKLPNATFHIQDAEVEYATGRCMCYSHLRHAYSADDVAQLIRRLYEGRVKFHNGHAKVAAGVELIHIGGHTKGLQAVRVHTERGWVVLASDASHYYANLEAENPFPIVFSVAEMFAGYDTLLAQADSPDHVVPGHDPQVLERYPRVPGVATKIACLHKPPCMPGTTQAAATAA